VGILIKRFFLFCLIIALFISVESPSAYSMIPLGRIPLEYKVRAAYIFNFARFIQWPPDTFHSPSSPLVIGVLGRDPFIPSLQAALNGALVEGRPVQIKEVDTPADLAAIHILYVGRSEEERISDDLSVLRHRPILTVSDARGFLEQGGMIKFSIEDEKIVFTVNAHALERSGLKASSQMLQFAEREE
jgi:hypothetical protein